MTPVRTLLLHVETSQNRSLSYQLGWPGQFARSKAFDCVVVNLGSARARAGLAARLVLAKPRLDAVVILHSVFSNECALRGALRDAVARLPAAKVFFIGNEYKLMPQKIDFARELEIDLLVTQLTSPDAQRLYRDTLGCEVLALPNTGLDTSVFNPVTPWRDRPIDVGYRAYDAPAYIGHDERAILARSVPPVAESLGLVVDVSVDPRDRLSGPDWPAFLNRCKGQLGYEAGGDWFELTDETRLAVNDYVSTHPDASFEDVQERFFQHRPRGVLGRSLSSRIIEAAGTKTVQLLFDGEYGGYFEPDVHYIALRKDLSNLEVALEKLRDEELCERIRDAAYEVAVSHLTYERLLDRLHATLVRLL